MLQSKRPKLKVPPKKQAKIRELLAATDAKIRRLNSWLASASTPVQQFQWIGVKSIEGDREAILRWKALRKKLEKDRKTLEKLKARRLKLAAELG